MVYDTMFTYVFYRRELRVFGVSVHLIEPGFFKTNICNLFMYI